MTEMKTIKKAFTSSEDAEKLYEEFRHDARGKSKATVTAALLTLLIEINKTVTVRRIGKELAGASDLYKLKGEQ